MQMVEGVTLPVGYQQIVSATLAAATGLTVPAAASSTTGLTAGRARFAIIQVESGNVRWRDDGTDPTSTVGMRLLQDDSIVYTGDISTIKFIREAAGAILNVSFYR